MSKFEFRNTETLLEIEGKSFTIDMGLPETIKSFDQLKGSTMKLLNDINEFQEKGKGDIEKTALTWCESVKKAVNGFLGDGSYEQIFAGRTVNLIHHLDLLSYVISEIDQSEKRLY